MIVNVNWTPTAPVKVVLDTKNTYKAIYEDGAGIYLFSIEKKKGKFFVISSGVKIPAFMTHPKERLKWEFSKQLGKVSPKVLN